MYGTQEQVVAGTHNALHPGEKRLVAAAKTGCNESFTMLVDRYHGQVLRYLTRQTGDRELAADLTQETFLDAFRRLARLADDRPFIAWVYRIARLNLLHEWRHQRSRRAVSLDLMLAGAGNAHRALHQPDKTASIHERDQIQHALNALSPTLREPLLLQSLGGFSSQEVAETLDISWAAARQRIARAKAQFRQQYRSSDRENHDTP